MQSKQCTKCGETKPFDSFCKNKRGKHGLNARCRDCMNAAGKAWYEKNRERSNAKSKRWHESNREKHNAINSQWQRENKKAVAKINRKYRQNHPDKNLEQSIRYRAAKLERIPSWANDQLIAAYYKEAKRLEELTGIEFHVDHIIPLQGELVSGLHVETNLQLLPAHENLGKSNKFDPATFCAHA